MRGAQGRAVAAAPAPTPGTDPRLPRARRESGARVGLREAKGHSKVTAPNEPGVVGEAGKVQRVLSVSGSSRLTPPLSLLCFCNSFFQAGVGGGGRGRGSPLNPLLPTPPQSPS